MIAALAFMVCGMASCNSSGGDKSVVEERDSLLEVSRQQAQLLDGMNMTLDEITLMMDSINQSEGNLFLAGGGKEVTNDRERIKNNIHAFESLLARQKEKIKALELKLKDSGANADKLQGVINLMKNQIAQKDQEIASLRSQLADSNRSIAELRNNVATLKENVTTLNQKNAVQKETLEAQDKMINECYYLVAGKKQLKAMGIVSGGNIFKKSKANLSNLPTERFNPVDIRKFRQIHIEGKKVKLLSPAPAGSYTLAEDGNGYTLSVIDATAFWSISNYLVIQAD